MTSPRVPVTLPYKTLSNGNAVLLDIYSPILLNDSISDSKIVPTIPAVVYFHGGGLIVGNKETFIPPWLMDRVLSLGYAFISPNYQLMPPATGHDIKNDIIDIFSFISKKSFQANEARKYFKIDPDRIIVAGSSAGGLCAYLAASCATPRPKACLSIYGQGGNFLTPFYIEPKLEPFYNNEPLLEPSGFEQYLYPYESQGTISPETDIFIPFPPAPPPETPRMELQKLYVQLGTYVDYYTGAHNPSLSQALLAGLRANRDTKEDIETSTVPEQHRSIFPNLLATRAKEVHWPPTLLIHGSADQAVLIDESFTIEHALKAAGVDVELIVAQGQNHGFDYGPEVEREWGWIFYKVVDFMKKAVESTSK